MLSTTVPVDGDDARIEVLATGDRPEVVLLPSALRGAGDFERLARDLLAAGFSCAAVNFRGVGQSSAVHHPTSLWAIVNDVADVITHATTGRVHIVGHAQGNVIARGVAAYRPELVSSVALLACGGHDLEATPVPAGLVAHFDRCHRTELSEQERLESLRRLFFAPDSDPSSWLDGWWPSADVREMFDDARPGEWMEAGGAPVLIVQPLEDPLCPPEVGRKLQARIGERARLVEVPRCSHAILPEQPETIAALLVEFLRAQRAGR